MHIRRCTTVQKAENCEVDSPLAFSFFLLTISCSILNALRDARMIIVVALVPDLPNPTICGLSRENVSRLNVIIAVAVLRGMSSSSFRHEREMHSRDPG